RQVLGLAAKSYPTRPHNPLVVGSSPTRPTVFTPSRNCLRLLFGWDGSFGKYFLEMAERTAREGVHVLQSVVAIRTDRDCRLGAPGNTDAGMSSRITISVSFGTRGAG